MKPHPLTILFFALLISSPALAETISEETPPISCGNQLIAGITCQGKYCDNISPICGRSRHEIEDIHWTDFVSEEGRGEISCDRSLSRDVDKRGYESRRDRDRRGDYSTRDSDRRDRSRDRSRRDRGRDRQERSYYPQAFIAGLSCQGKYCDDLALECVTLHESRRARRSRQCEWTDWISEERGTLQFPRGYAAVSLACRGKYCDDKSFYICPLEGRRSRR